jgi:hypothetical protein
MILLESNEMMITFIIKKPMQIFIRARFSDEIWYTSGAKYGTFHTG